MKNASRVLRLVPAVLLVGVLSATPYVLVYGIDRILGAPDAARAALWPTAITPVLVGAAFAFELAQDRRSRRRNAAAEPARASSPARRPRPQRRYAA